MHVTRFTNEYEAVAPLYGVSAAELRASDQERGEELQRWFAGEGSRPLGAVDARLRPDNRLFLVFRTTEASAFGPLSAAARTDLGRSVSATCDDSDSERLVALQQAGFQIEVTTDRFVVPFPEALQVLRRAWIPSGYAVRSVADVDEERAFALDNRVRSLVPGTDGWIGNRDWFSDELRSEELDPNAYLLAVEQATDEFAGLVRIWRNPDGPRLGLIGILPEHRRTPLAAALLKQGLEAASTWGHEAFGTETSLANKGTYPALRRMGLTPVGRFHQLLHP